MKLLALDTATDACSVALAVGAGQITARFQRAPREQARLLLPMVKELLSESGLALAQLDGLAFGRGPGSFTGVRIATGVIQGLALGADLPVVGVSDLAMLAQGAMRRHDCPRVLSCMDARMGEFYWCAYERSTAGMASPLVPEELTAAAGVRAPDGRGWFGAGSGWTQLASGRAAATGARVTGRDPQALPDARDALPLAAHEFAQGHGLAPELALPVYLREQVARRPAR